MEKTKLKTLARSNKEETTEMINKRNSNKNPKKCPARVPGDSEETPRGAHLEGHTKRTPIGHHKDPQGKKTKAKGKETLKPSQGLISKSWAVLSR